MTRPRSGGSLVHSYCGANSSESQRSQTQALGFPSGSLADWGPGALTGRGSRPCFGFGSPGIGDHVGRLLGLWAAESPSSGQRFCSLCTRRREPRGGQRAAHAGFGPGRGRGGCSLPRDQQVAALGSESQGRTHGRQDALQGPTWVSLAAAAQGCRGVEPGATCRRVCVCVPGVRHVRRAHACVWTYVFSFRPDDDSAAGDVTILTSKTSKLRPEESSRSTELSGLWSLHARPTSGRGAVSLCPQTPATVPEPSFSL